MICYQAGQCSATSGVSLPLSLSMYPSGPPESEGYAYAVAVKKPLWNVQAREPLLPFDHFSLSIGDRGIELDIFSNRPPLQTESVIWETKIPLISSPCGTRKGHKDSRMLGERVRMNEGEEGQPLWEKDEGLSGKEPESGRKNAASSAPGPSFPSATSSRRREEDEPPESLFSPEEQQDGKSQSSFGGEEPSGRQRQWSRARSQPGDRAFGAETEGEGGKGSFLFIGPVGKKRRHWRQRHHSGDTEDMLSPSPSAATSPPDPSCVSGETEPPPLIEVGDMSMSEEDSSRSRGSGKSGQDEGQGRGGTTPNLTTTTATATPTSVIRSTRKRREEQPLNLSSSTFELEQSPAERVSVINIVSRERLAEEGNRSPRFEPEFSLYGEGQGQGQGHGPRSMMSPSQSHSISSSEMFTISSSSAMSLLPGPSSFQGLLISQGMMQQHQLQQQYQNTTGTPVSSGAQQKKKLKCRDCGKEFSQLRNYKYHRSRHEGTQQFACTCPVCGKTFNDKGYLSSHLKIHRNEKEYKCEWCGKSFNQRVAYNMHIRIHTGHKPHKCTYCPKAFSRKMLLRQHIRTHTGERPYKCAICEKAFADRSNMLLHQRLHSGERPYKCHICGKSFSKNHHLKTHLNHHAGIKPYQCEKCKACFSQSSNMKTHFRKCTGVPSASSMVAATVTSTADYQHQQQQSGPGPSHSRSLQVPLSLLSPQTSGMIPSPFSMGEATEQRLRQLQHEQFSALSPGQQQQLLQDLQATLAAVPSPMHSPSSGRSSGSGSAFQLQPRSSAPSSCVTQSLGFSLSTMSLSPGTGVGMRSRRGSGLLLNPSPTSLAAGHPFIPLSALETMSLSPSGSHSQMLSPREFSGDLGSPELAQMHALSQAQQRGRSSSRELSLQQTEIPLPSISSGSSGRSRVLHTQQVLQPQSIPISRISPGRQHSSQSHSQSSQEFYDVFVPALSLPTGPLLSPRERAELIAEEQQRLLARQQDLQQRMQAQRLQAQRTGQGQSRQSPMGQSQQGQGLHGDHSGTLIPSISTPQLLLRERDAVESVEQRLREAQAQSLWRSRGASSGTEKNGQQGQGHFHSP